MLLYQDTNDGRVCLSRKVTETAKFFEWVDEDGKTRRTPKSDVRETQKKPTRQLVLKAKPKAAKGKVSAPAE